MKSLAYFTYQLIGNSKYNRIDVKYFVWIKIEFKRMKDLLFSNFSSKIVVLMQGEILK